MRLALRLIHKGYIKKAEEEEQRADCKLKYSLDNPRSAPLASRSMDSVARDISIAATTIRSTAERSSLGIRIHQVLD